MNKDIVAVTDHIKDFSIEREILGKYFNNKLSNETTIALVWHKVINEDFFIKYPSIKAIVRYGVGYDNIDIDFCKKKNILVANTPDYGIDEVSDSAIAMILYLTRKIGRLENLAYIDSEYWLGKDLNLNMRRLNQLSLGIIGLGRIGSSIARKFSLFSKHIGFYDPYIPNGYEKVFGISKFDNLSDLLKFSDIVTINTPLNEQTKGMVDKDFLSQMKKGSYLINLSRGPIIKSNDIILDNLLSSNLEGYATDVWTSEPPLVNDKLYKAWKEKNTFLQGKIIINPHTSYYSEQAIKESREKASLNVLNIIKNNNISNVII